MTKRVHIDEYRAIMAEKAKDARAVLEAAAKETAPDTTSERRRSRRKSEIVTEALAAEGQAPLSIEDAIAASNGEPEPELGGES